MPMANIQMYEGFPNYLPKQGWEDDGQRHTDGEGVREEADRLAQNSSSQGLH